MRGNSQKSTHKVEEAEEKEIIINMGRPPCCDKVGIKKGPWTPEEDIILVSYIQEHGPGNWRSVPTNTGLLRCSKSCRLRWTNYLRPGIKRGNFTPHEEGMIIHLQALLGNKWAAIASYLPQRTDNDIKNYWNTHLKKKIKKFQSNLDPQISSNINLTPQPSFQFVSKSFNESNTEDGKVNTTSSSVYASSAENISRLLEGWMRSSSSNSNSSPKNSGFHHQNGGNDDDQVVGNGTVCKHEFDSLDNLDYGNNNHDDDDDDDQEKKLGKVENIVNPPPLSFLENWLLDETIGQEVMGIPSIF